MIDWRIVGYFILVLIGISFAYFSSKDWSGRLYTFAWMTLIPSYLFTLTMFTVAFLNGGVMEASFTINTYGEGWAEILWIWMSLPAVGLFIAVTIKERDNIIKQLRDKE